MKRLETAWLGLVGYETGLWLQVRLRERRAEQQIPDTLIQLEHPHVFTVGRRGSRADVLWDERTLVDRGVEVVDADRGGQVTYHGPGQLVGYPIFDLGRGADLVRYVRNLEEVLIGTLSELGVWAGRIDGLTGVWAGEEKVAAIGVRVTRGVTKHGFALNVSPDLAYFSGIVPCGALDRGVTSVARLIGDAPPVEAVATIVESKFGEVFGFDPVDRVEMAVFSL